MEGAACWRGNSTKTEGVGGCGGGGGGGVEHYPLQSGSDNTLST